MERENDRLIRGKQRVELFVGKTVRVLALRLKSHQIHSVDDANLQIGKALAQDVDSGKGLERRNVSGTGHYDIGFSSLIRAGPVPDTNSLCTMVAGRLHVEILQRRLFPRNDYIDVVAAAQAVISHREQRVGIGRKIYSDDLGFLFHYKIDETRILMAEAIMILPPNVRSQQI